jgi:DNA-directed RNA polymerase subunit RPC12/RpoP
MTGPDVSDTTIEGLCNRCGKAFSVFLHQMADQNEKVVCPECRETVDCEPVKGARPVAGRKPARKPN